MTLYDYTGVIHLHSSLSFDGHTPMKRIIAAAEKNGIDFIMLTDHDHLKARDEGWEGWQGKPWSLSEKRSLHGSIIISHLRSRNLFFIRITPKRKIRKDILMR